MEPTAETAQGTKSQSGCVTRTVRRAKTHEEITQHTGLKRGTSGSIKDKYYTKFAPLLDEIKFSS
jgi:hypothetical protein